MKKAGIHEIAWTLSFILGLFAFILIVLYLVSKFSPNLFEVLKLT